MNALREKLKLILTECSQHQARVLRAYGKMKSKLPLSIDTYSHLSEDDIEHIDQFLFRFSRLQDAMGKKLFHTLLLLLEEPVRDMPFVDILNHLERLGFLKAQDWLDLRNMRNNIAHEYSLETDELVDSLNAILEEKDKLLFIYEAMREYCEERF